MKNASSSVKLGILIKGVGLAYAMLGIFALVLALVAYFSSWHYGDVVYRATTYLSVLIGALYMGLKLKSKLWLNGVLLGLIYLVVITAVQKNIALFIQWYWLKQLLIVCGVGVLGSIIGGLMQR